MIKSSTEIRVFKGNEAYYGICGGPKKYGKIFKARINRRLAKRAIHNILKEI